MHPEIDSAERLCLTRDCGTLVNELADRLEVQAEATRDGRLRTELLTAACDLLEKALERHRPPSVPASDSSIESARRG
jgi:hypothetical protein